MKNISSHQSFQNEGGPQGIHAARKETSPIFFGKKRSLAFTGIYTVSTQKYATRSTIFLYNMGATSTVLYKISQLTLVRFPKSCFLIISCLPPETLLQEKQRKMQNCPSETWTFVKWENPLAAWETARGNQWAVQCAWMEWLHLSSVLSQPHSWSGEVMNLCCFPTTNTIHPSVHKYK